MLDQWMTRVTDVAVDLSERAPSQLGSRFVASVIMIIML